MNTLTVLQTLINTIFTTNGNREITGQKTRETLNAVLGATYMPAGATMDWHGPSTTIPAGWSLRDGRSLSITDYNDLFLNLGGYQSPYGVNVGAGTFQIPNVPEGYTEIQCGATTGYALGNILGERAHALSANENGQHKHSGISLGGSNSDNGDPGNLVVTSPGEYNGVNAISGSVTDYSGLGAPHNNMPPSICVNKIIKLY